MPDLSERLRILRKEKGLTQQEVGDTLGKSLRAYQYYESGTRSPEYPQLLALADFFDDVTPLIAVFLPICTLDGITEFSPIVTSPNE